MTEYAIDLRWQVIALNTQIQISTNLVYNGQRDIEGDVWVGTAAGPVIFDYGKSLTKVMQGTRHKVVKMVSLAIYWNRRNCCLAVEQEPIAMD